MKRSFFGITVASLLGVASPAWGTITATPASVSVFPTETSATIRLDLTFTPPPVAGPPLPGMGTVEVLLPPALSGNTDTVPTPVRYPFTRGVGTSSTSFQFRTTAATPPGSYTVTLQDATFDAGSTTVQLIVQQPSFTAAASPNPLQLVAGGAPGAVTVTTSADPGLAGVAYSFVGFPGFLDFGPAQNTVGPAFPPLTFNVIARARAPAGTYGGALRGSTTAETKDFPFTVVVEAAPTFTATASPNPLGLTMGNGPAEVTVSTVADAGFASSGITYSFTGFPAFLEFGAPRTTPAPTYAPLQFQVSMRLGPAVAGTYNGNLRGQAAAGTKSFPFTVIVRRGAAPPSPPPPTPGFTFSVDPNPVELVLGGAAQPLRVTTQAELGLAVPGVTYSLIGLPAFFSGVTPQIALGPTYGPVQFTLGLGPGAVRGTYPGAVRAEAPGLAPLEVPFAVVVRGPVPAILGVSPSSLASGSLGTRVRLAGRNFESGAQASSTSAALRVLETQVLSAALAEVVVAILPGARPGQHELVLTNPGGEMTRPGARVTIVPADSLAAPLAVPAAAIVFPLEGSLVAVGERVFPRALLATTGSGTITGSWLLDGVAFERFAVRAAAGLPVALAGAVPIPGSAAGPRRLQLRIDEPQLLLTPPVSVMLVLDRAAELRLYGPPDRTVLAPGEAAEFRWSLVPGTSGYEVTIDRPLPLLPLRARVADATWKPTPEELAALGPGVWSWTVRPVFPGEALGSPSEASAFVVLPEKVALLLDSPWRDPTSGRFALRWSGGAPGLVYLVEFFRGEETEPGFSALTAEPQYLLPQGTPVEPGLRVRVRALGPSGEELGRSEFITVAQAARPADRVRLASTGRALEVLRMEPALGSVVTSDRPSITLAWSGAAEADSISLFIDSIDVTAATQFNSAGLSYAPPLPLAPGDHMVLVKLGEQQVGWSFQVAAPEPAGAGGAPADSQGGSSGVVFKHNYNANGEWSITEDGGDPPDQPLNGLGTLSAQGDLGGGFVTLRGTGDLSWAGALEDEGGFRQQSRNWLMQPGVVRPQVGSDGLLGYASPRFLDQAELLNPGLSRGGVEAKLGSSRLAISYFLSLDDELRGLVSLSTGAEQNVEAAALELPLAGQRLTVRAVGLEVDEKTGEFSPGGRGELFGIFARYTGPRGLTLLFEGGRGEYEPRPGGFEERAEGPAYRLGLAFARQAFNLTLNARRMDAGFVNPANRGLTPGGRSGRDIVDLAFNWGLGRGSLQAQLNHLREPNPALSSGENRATGGNASLSWTLAPRLNLTLAGNLLVTRGDGSPEASLPALDRRDWGTVVTLAETLRGLQFSQALTFQKHTDGADSATDSETTSLTLSATGTVVPGLDLNFSATGTRLEGDPLTLGRNDTLTVSLQPVWRLQRLWLAFQPVALYTESESELAASENRSEMYQMRVVWGPPWFASLVSLQLGTDWTRQRSRPGGEDVGFSARHTASFVLRQGRTQSGEWQLGRPPTLPLPLAATTPPAVRTHRTWS